MAVYLAGGQVCQSVQDASFTREKCTTGASLSDGAWHHLVLIDSSGSGLGELYVDGSLPTTESARMASDPIAGTPSSSHTVGYGPINISGDRGYFNGQVDDIRWWWLDLSQTEVAALSRGAFGDAALSLYDPEYELIAWWPLEESGSDATAADVNGTYHATLVDFSFTTSPWVAAGAH
jgi:hypothetical protein